MSIQVQESRCLRVRQSSKASAASLSCNQHRHRRRSRVRSIGWDHTERGVSSRRTDSREPIAVSIRCQSDTSASPSRTNEISTSFRPRFAGEASASARFSCLVRFCASTSIDCLARSSRVDHPTLYEVLRIPASASPSELRVAFKLRDLELRTAGVRHRDRVALERAFNIVGQPELRACYDALLADPEAPAVFPYGGFGSLVVAGEPSRDGKTFLCPPHPHVFTGSTATTVPCAAAQMRFLRRPGTVPRHAPQAGVLARSSRPAHTLGPHLESVEVSIRDQDRGRGHIRTERRIS